MADVGNVLDDVRELKRRVDLLERAVKTLGEMVMSQGTVSDPITRIMEELGLWQKPKRRTRARR